MAMWTITIEDTHNLIIMKSDTVLDYSNLRDFLNQVYIEDEGRLASYDRFADISRLENIDVDIDTVVETVKAYRAFKPPTSEVKVAVFSPYGLTGALVHIYKLLTENDSIFKIQTYKSVEECAEFLQVDKSVLNHS